ncbi:hypothetical protein [Streptomyces sp. NPDC058255]|uniref:hypothetical protein n=1 Tax=Streptomyces sp. NPDC058255 TaxID=3346407 RepID=UPI0036E55DCC
MDLDELRRLLPPIRPSDTLLLAGSVNEGLANQNSVLDLLMISIGGIAADSRALPAPSATYLLGKGHSVRVLLYSSAALEEIAATTSRFDEALYEPAALARLPRLGEEARVLLHELRVGYGLLNPTIARAWRENLRVDRLHCYLAVLHLLRHRARLRAAMTYAPDGDAETTRWMLQESAEELLAMILAAAGESNPRKRWHLKLLRARQEDIGVDVVERLVVALTRWHADAEEHLGIVVALADELVSIAIGLCPELAAAADLDLAVHRAG